ncbi:hypothetical protein VOLCADRAFT_91657 [Volvox carteri f. nagariensis]|uniref:BTB domain-containing protein n=1 Tax=Volvox carteri f. nagariensis TaxID=3068 RepID=D8TXN3_VOLCA|nr:uncharacterized protein VOLCADRAFT_91657 [Volvox carteri f. nagariensis]EFJ47670.1 hypothetical protein VOLCADRAFT_91657 [Volvox carteri f. nagariensis]|eukprot:XP_002951141.1 hypothetical protein VOLCADRAFT_91657 [Volvox carteri f. nagariensis]
MPLSAPHAATDASDSIGVGVGGPGPNCVVWRRVGGRFDSSSGCSSPPQLLLRLPLVGADSVEDWVRLLELIYPPTRLPRPAIGWDNIDSVIVLADKYGMSGLLLLCEAFLLSNGGGGGGGSTTGAAFSCDPEDRAYVWKWLQRADRLRMERVGYG